jgi:hypothetical protein
VSRLPCQSSVAEARQNPGYSPIKNRQLAEVPRHRSHLSISTRSPEEGPFAALISPKICQNGDVRQFLKCVVLSATLAASARAQTNLHTVADDGAFTWFNDPRALFHNGRLYVGHVRSDGRSALVTYDPGSGIATTLWTSSWVETDDHDNPGLLRLEDGRLMAIYARHSNSPFYAQRTSLNTNPIAPADWGSERIFNVSATVTYANPYQLPAESGRLYNFMRNLNFNPTFVTSDNLGTNWSAPKILIQAGTGSVRPYLKFDSDYIGRIDFLYTDGHPRDVPNSLYHVYYQTGVLHRTDGSFLKYFTNAPLMHDSGERGSMIYQYSDFATSDPNEHIPMGRAWCWEIVRPPNAQPVCVFTVQRDSLSWSEDRIYYYYARWDGAAWQKRFIANAGRPLYQAEDDYAGGICIDPENPSVVYLSSNAADPFDLNNITNVPLRANARYELYRGVTADGGLTFSWTALTTNSAVDNLRPYVPRHAEGQPAVIWFRGIYNTYSSFSGSVVALLTNQVRVRPAVRIENPRASLIQLTNLANSIKLTAVAEDDGYPAPLSLRWATAVGPTNASFTDTTNSETLVSFPQAGHYLLRVTASDGLSTAEAKTTVYAGSLPPTTNADPSRVLWLKLDETFGAPTDSSGNAFGIAPFGQITWQPSGGVRGGALKFSGNGSWVQVSDYPLLDNTAAFTLACWFRLDVWPAGRVALVAKAEGSSANAYSILLDPNSRRMQIDVNGSNDRFSGPLVTTGVWHHVALAYNGALPTAQRVQLWLNGSLEVVAAESSASIPDYGSSLRLGWITGFDYYFNGAIDDVRFHRRTLNAEEIIALAHRYTAPSVSPGAAPIATNQVLTRLNGQSTAAARWSQLSGPADAIFDGADPATSIQFVRAGDYMFRLCAETPVASACQDLAIHVRPNFHVYEDWIARAFPGVTDTLVIAEQADPDGDGELNFVEFGFASDPSQPGPYQFRIERKSDGSLWLVHPTRLDPARRYNIFVSPDLQSWQDAYPNLSLDTITRPPDQDEYQILHYRLRETLPASSFFRIRVE